MTRRVSSIFLVFLLTSALFISISSIIVPPEVRALTTLTLILTPGNGKFGDVISVNTNVATPPTSSAGTVCSITGSVPNLVIPVSGSAATAVVTDVGGVLHVIGAFKVGNAPGPAGAGTYSVIVKCPSSGTTVDSGSAVFTLDPAIALSASVVVVGQIVTVTGVGFKSDETGCDTTGLAIKDVTTNIVDLTTVSCTITGGSMSGSFSVKAGGVLPVADTITVQSFGGATAIAGITKVSSPLILITPASVPPGFGTLDGTVSITGGGFAAGSSRTCQVTETTSAPIFASSPTIACTVSSSGTVTASFAVAITAAPAAYTVRVTDTNPAGAFADKAFTVDPAPVLDAASPLTGPTGTLVTLTQTGGGAVKFSVQDTGPCTITSAPTGLASLSTCFIDATGKVLAAGATNLIVSATAPGQTYFVRVTGLHGDYAETPFTVTAAVTITPSSGSPPVVGSPGAPATEVTISGTGFSASDTSCTIAVTPALTGTLNIDTTGEPPCTVSAGVLTARFKVGPGSTYDPAGTPQYSIVVTGTPASDAAPAVTFDVKPQIASSPIYGPAGIAVVVSGSGFDPGLGPPCTFSSSPAGLDNPAAVCTHNVDGTALATFTVSTLATALNQNYTITITGGALTIVASTGFTKTGAMNLFPTSGHLGTNVLISGTGFNPLDTGCTILSSPSGLISNPLCAVAGGSLSGSFTVASGSTGTYTVKVVGTTGDEGRATFTVPSVATLILNPIQGEVSTVVSAAGSNYQGTTCLITATPSGLFASQSCSIVAGTLTGSFTVALGAAAGTLYTVTVETNAGAGDSATATFAVTAGPTSSLTLTPPSGPAGTVVSGNGTGFPTDTSCVLISIPLGIFSSPSCTVAGGNAAVGFTVSSSATAGSYTILVLGNTGRSASASFTVTATPLFSLSANPSSLVLSPGGTGTVTVTILSIGGFNSPVTLTAPLPAGVSGGFSPNPVTPPAGGSITSTLLISVSSAAVSSTTGITITGTGGGSATATSITLVIQVFVTSTATSSATSTTLSTTTAPWTPPRPCIIATVTFGSEVSPAVQFLRNFRDGLVLSTKAGSAFMEVFNAWYYSFSPSVAGLIAGNDPLRAPVRVLLYPLLGILGVSSLAYSLLSGVPEFAIVVAGLAASSLIGLVYLTLPAMFGVRALLKRRRVRLVGVAKGSAALLTIALALLAVGEVTGSFLLLAIGGSATVLTCLIAAPAIFALAMLHPNRE